MSITRQGTIRVCLRDLSQRLARAHGVRDAYAPAEIASVLKEWDMHLSHPAYAYAIFCTRGDFERLDPGMRGGRDYEEWRQDVRRQYPQVGELGSRDLIDFARERWSVWGRSGSVVDFPDGPRAEHSAEEVPARGLVALALVAGIGVIIALVLLVAWRLNG